MRRGRLTLGHGHALKARGACLTVFAAKQWTTLVAVAETAKAGTVFLVESLLHQIGFQVGFDQHVPLFGFALALACF